MKQRILQIQPQFQKGDEWMQLAESCQLQFECMELSTSSFLESGKLKEKAEEWYKKYTNSKAEADYYYNEYEHSKRS